MTNTRWRVVFYEREDGRCPVGEFLDGLGLKERAKVLAAIDLLEEEGSGLRRPYTDFLKDGIYELRVRVSRVRYRVLYFFSSRTDIVLTHSFRKKSKSVPKNEIARAARYRKDWMRRYHANA